MPSINSNSNSTSNSNSNSTSNSRVLAAGWVLALAACIALAFVLTRPSGRSAPAARSARSARAGDRIVAATLGSIGGTGYLRTIRRLSRRRFDGRLAVTDAGTFPRDAGRDELPRALATLEPTWILLSVSPEPGAAAEDTAGLRDTLRAVHARTHAAIVLLPAPLVDENTRSPENTRRLQFAQALRDLGVAEGAVVADVDGLLSLSLRAAQMRGRSFHLTADTGSRLHEAGEFLIAAAALESLGIALPDIIDQAQPDDPAVPADDGRIQYWGDWDRRQAHTRGAVTVSTGSTIVAAFEGTGILAHFDTGQYVYDAPSIWVRIDDEPWRCLRLREQLPLSDRELRDGRHVVWIVVKSFYPHGERWTPPLEADVVFRGMSPLPRESGLPSSRPSAWSRLGVLLSGARLLSVERDTIGGGSRRGVALGDPTGAGGRLVAPPPRPRAVVESFGDSLVEGVEGALDSQGDLEDGRSSWAYQSTLAAGAEPRLVGFAGMGVTIGGNGGAPPALYTFLGIHDGAAREEARSPDVVVVCLGTNDGPMPSDAFVESFEAFLRAVSRRHDRATILCLRPFSGIHGDDVRAAVVDVARAGEARIEYVDTTGWVDPTSQTSDGIHLNAEGNQAVTRRFAPIVLRALLRHAP